VTLYIALTADCPRASGTLLTGARDRLVEDLRQSPPSYHPSLRLKRHQASGPGVYELSFGDGGRALLRFGYELREGVPHVEWLAIGSHRADLTAPGRDGMGALHALADSPALVGPCRWAIRCVI